MRVSCKFLISPSRSPVDKQMVPMCVWVSYSLSGSPSQPRGHAFLTMNHFQRPPPPQGLTPTFSLQLPHMQSMSITSLPHDTAKSNVVRWEPLQLSVPHQLSSNLPSSLVERKGLLSVPRSALVPALSGSLLWKLQTIESICTWSSFSHHKSKTK